MRADRLLALLALLCISNSAFADSGPFLEQGGILMVEVESEPATGQWSVQNSIAGYTGSSYYRWDGPNHLGGPSGDENSHITYRFRITTPGNYELRWRSRITKGDNPTEHNDSWIRFPSGQNIIDEEPLNGWTKVYMSQLNTWSWDAYTVDGKAQSVRQYFAAGDHTMQISGRSNGHAIDRIALYQYDSVNYSNNKFSTMTPSARTDSTGAEHSQMANTCSEGVLSLAPWAAATVVDQSDALPEELSLSGDQRVALLQYDLSHVPAIVNDASLMLIQATGSTKTSGKVSVYLGSHAQWQAEDDAQSMPYAASMLGNDSLSADTGEVSRIKLDHLQFNRDKQSLLLMTDNSNDDINLEADPVSRAPRLEFTLANRQACFTSPVLDLSELGAEEPVQVAPPGLPEQNTQQNTDQSMDQAGDQTGDQDGNQSEDSTSETTQNGSEGNDSDGSTDTSSGNNTGNNDDAVSNGDDSSTAEPASGNSDSNGNANEQNLESNADSSTQSSSKRRFGGSLSYWLVCLMSLLSLVRYRLRYKTREKRSRDF